MKILIFIVALLLFIAGVYFFIRNDYPLAILLMVTMIAFLNLTDHSPPP